MKRFINMTSLSGLPGFRRRPALMTVNPESTAPGRFGLKQVAGVLASMALSAISFSVCALGLGDVRSQSFLGQPLEATIELVNVNGNLAADNLLVRHVGPEEATKMGAEVYYGIYQLEVKLQKGVNGYDISVTTKLPVSEPYLSMLIELRWPSGVVYREYPVLLDPPPVITAAERSQKRSLPRKAEPVPEPKVAAARSRPSVARVQAVPRPIVQDVLATSGGKYEVKSGDNLSQISASWRGGSTQSIPELNEWIFQNNPAAFSRDSMDFLKVGAVLTMPNFSSLAVKDTPEGDVARAAEADRASGRTGDVDASSTAEPEGILSNSDALKNEPLKGMLTVSQLSLDDKSRELIDMLSRENQTLKERMQQMEGDEYISIMRELVVLQQEQIQELQARIGRAGPVTPEVEAMLETVGLAAPLSGSGVSPAGDEQIKPATKQEVLRDLGDISSEAITTEKNDQAIIELDPEGLSAIAEQRDEKRSRLIAILVVVGGILAAIFLAMFFYYRKLVASGQTSQEELPALDADAEASTLGNDEPLLEPGFERDFSESIVTDGDEPSTVQNGNTEVDLAFDNLDREFADIDLNVDVNILEEGREGVTHISAVKALADTASTDSASSASGDIKPSKKSRTAKKVERVVRRSDEEVKTAIAAKMAQYSSDDTSGQESLSALELDELEHFDEGDYDEIDTIVYRAMMFCEFKKFDKARSLIEDKMDSDGDPRLEEALARVNGLEENANRKDVG